MQAEAITPPPQSHPLTVMEGIYTALSVTAITSLVFLGRWLFWRYPAQTHQYAGWAAICASVVVWLLFSWLGRFQKPLQRIGASFGTTALASFFMLVPAGGLLGLWPPDLWRQGVQIYMSLGLFGLFADAVLKRSRHRMTLEKYSVGLICLAFAVGTLGLTLHYATHAPIASLVFAAFVFTTNLVAAALGVVVARHPNIEPIPAG